MKHCLAAGPGQAARVLPRGCTLRKDTTRLRGEAGLALGKSSVVSLSSAGVTAVEETPGGGGPETEWPLGCPHLCTHPTAVTRADVAMPVCG